MFDCKITWELGSYNLSLSQKLTSQAPQNHKSRTARPTAAPVTSAACTLIFEKIP